MAANVLHQVPWFAPTRDVFQSSKPKSFVVLKFSVSCNHKAQHIKTCSSLAASRGGDAFHICCDFRERKLIACAQATDAPSESQEETAEIDQETDGGENSEDSSNGTALQVANDQSETTPKQRTPKLNEVMGILHRRAIEAVDKKRPIPDIRVGDVLQLRVTVPRTRRRFALYKGVVISKQNSGIQTTIRLRRIIAGVGIEIVFPLYSPLITEVIILERRKVRRARLYYLRDKLPKFSTVK